MGWFTDALAKTEDRRWPAEYQQPWALVDVETSGLRPGQHRVLQVAVLTADASGSIETEWSTLLNPGCDPGPVHIHGITTSRLAGAPTFEQVAPQLATLLAGRTMVAHNAGFDYEFLRHEFARVGLSLPVQRRLCTLALNRRIGTLTENMQLGTLAQHYGVVQNRAHDALDDTRVLAGILRASLSAAVPLGLALPLVDCPPKQSMSFPPRIPKRACAFRCPGSWAPGAPLVQGMKIAITGDTSRPREELVLLGAAAGLNMMGSVSGRTSALVTNDAGTPERMWSNKSQRAQQEGVPLVDEATFVQLLGAVVPGEPLEEKPTGPRIPAQARPQTARRQPAVARGLLAGHRVMVMGGDPVTAADARARAVAQGAVASVNLSANVTDIVALPGCERDKRWTRVLQLGLPCRDLTWLSGHEAPAEPTPAGVPAAPTVPSESGLSAVAEQLAGRVRLSRGEVTDLPDGSVWTLSASWSDIGTGEVDLVAFVLDDDELVTSDDGMVFYNNPDAYDGAVVLSTGSPTQQAITVNLDLLPSWASIVRITAAIDGTATFGDVGAIALEAESGEQGAVFAEATLDAGTTERTLVLADVYRRAGVWRLRAVGQGWDHLLQDVAIDLGVDIDE